MIASKGKAKQKLSEEEKREKIREAMLKKKSYEETALKIVEQLMETGLSDEFLIDTAKALNQSFYSDAVEERSLTGLCGYPLCDKIKPAYNRKGKYHISITDKKVYDLEERKLFCSNQCFKASNFFKDQLETSPLWLRESESVKKITLLANSEKQSTVLRGEELDIALKESLIVHGAPKVNLKEGYCESDEGNDDLGSIMSESTELEHPPAMQQQVTNQRRQPYSDPDVKISAWDVASKTITDWFTIDSFRFIFGDEALVARLKESNLSEETWATSVGDPSLDECYQARYRELCRKLDLIELLEDTEDNEGSVGKLPMPSFDMLKKHCEEENLKMDAFLAGQQSFQRDLVSGIVENDVGGLDPRIPLLDHKAQQQLRRRLVMDGLLKSLPDILKLLKLTLNEILDDLKKFVNSFKFEADNVVFKSDEWTLISLIVLKILSAKNDNVERSMQGEDQKKYLTLVLMSFQTDLTQINVLIRDTTSNIKQLVTKY